VSDLFDSEWTFSKISTINTKFKFLKIFDSTFIYNGPATDIVEVQITGEPEEIGKIVRNRPDKMFPNSTREIKQSMSAVSYTQIMIWLHSEHLQNVFRKKPPLDIFLKSYDKISQNYCKPLVFPKRSDAIEDLNTTLYLFQIESLRSDIVPHQVSRSVKTHTDDNCRLGDAPPKRRYNDFSDSTDDYKALFPQMSSNVEYPDYLVTSPIKFNIGSNDPSSTQK